METFVFWGKSNIGIRGLGGLTPRILKAHPEWLLAEGMTNVGCPCDQKYKLTIDI